MIGSKLNTISLSEFGAIESIYKLDILHRIWAGWQHKWRHEYHTRIDYQNQKEIIKGDILWETAYIGHSFPWQDND